MRPTGTSVQRRGRPVPTARLACGRQRAGESPGGDGSPGIPPEAHSATSRPAHTQLLCEGAALPPTPALILIAVLVGRRAFQSDATAPRDLGAPHPPPRPPPHGPLPSANAQNPDGKVWGRFGCPRGGGGGAPGIWGAETRQPLSAPRDRAASPGRQCC